MILFCNNITTAKALQIIILLELRNGAASRVKFLFILTQYNHHQGRVFGEERCAEAP